MPEITDEQYRDLYEGRYARAGSNYAAIPWAALRPNDALIEWLAADGVGSAGPGDGRRGASAGAGDMGAGEARAARSCPSALVVGCGFGDDAEHVAACGYAVTAFDFAPSAVAQAQSRFPDSAVDYRVADLLSLPGSWLGVYDLVVDVRTIQSMPRDRRAAAVADLGSTVAPGGILFLYGLGAPNEHTLDGPPWPVTPAELEPLAERGLVRSEHRTEPFDGGAWLFASVYRRT